MRLPHCRGGSGDECDISGFDLCGFKCCDIGNWGRELAPGILDVLRIRLTNAGWLQGSWPLQSSKTEAALPKP